MSFEFRRVVTVLGEGGRSKIHEDADLSVIEVPIMPGAGFVKLWGTDALPEAGAADPTAVHDPFFPEPPGNRWAISIFPPASDEAAEQASADDVAVLASETDKQFPGLADAFDADDPGFHTSDTVDYVMVIEGEVYLKVDDGELLLKTGACVVQNGTRHAWENRSDARAVVVSLLFGAPRVR